MRERSPRSVKQVAPSGADLPAALGEDTYKEGISKIMQGSNIVKYSALSRGG